jgi:hypothetical protein
VLGVFFGRAHMIPSADCGTVSTTVHLGSTPSIVSTVISSKITETGASARVDMHPDGHMSVTIDRPDGRRLHDVQFQRVRVAEPGSVQVATTWSATTVSFFLDTHKLGPHVADDAPRIIQTKKAFVPSGPISFSHPDSLKACNIWIDNRRQKLSEIRAPRSGRRMKSTAEQSRDLFIAANNLEAIAKFIQLSRQTHLIGYLAVELRSLIYWTKDKSREGGYNPLLLRMASMANLPLPVFGRKNPLLDWADFPESPLFFFFSEVAAVQQFSNKQILMDLQEWLKEDFTVHRRCTGLSGLLDCSLQIVPISE